MNMIIEGKYYVVESINVCQNDVAYKFMKHQYKINFKYYTYFCEICKLLHRSMNLSLYHLMTFFIY